MRRFREHAASIKAFPALFSANRNGTHCNPGEAVFLIYLLISEDGALNDKNLDAAKALTQLGSQRNEGWKSFGFGQMETLDSNVSGLLSSYSSNHNNNATMALFYHMAGMLGF